MTRSFAHPLSIAILCTGGCVGGVVTDVETGTRLDGATVTVWECPGCPAHATTTPSGTGYAEGYPGSWAFDPYHGGEVIQPQGVDAIRVRVSRSGYRTRTLFHRVDLEPYTLPGGDEIDWDRLDIGVLRTYSGDTDSDGDGLRDRWETWLGTDPDNADTDGDGLPDGWEVDGHDWVDYPALGVDPLRRDLLVEVDYQHYWEAGILHSARLSDAVVTKLEELFDDLPIGNPDGTWGVSLHVVHDDTLPADFSCTTEFLSTDRFDPRHRDAFHYAALCIGPPVGLSGGLGPQRLMVRYEEVDDDPDNDWDEWQQHGWYSRFAHELGHNLGLQHGGSDTINCKPNYPSLMNNAYGESFLGSERTLNASLIQFSSGALSSYPIAEYALREQGTYLGLQEQDIAFLESYRDGTIGVSGNSVDWNGDGTWQPSTYALDINGWCTGGGGTGLTVMRDYDDVTHIEVFLGQAISAGQ